MQWHAPADPRPAGRLGGRRVAARGTADELKDQLGGNVLEVQVTRRADLDKAASLIAALGTAPVRLEPALNRVTLPVQGGARVLIAAGRALDDAGVELEDLGIRRPSLDDVFLAITGHPAAPVDDAAQAPHPPEADQ